MSNLAVVSTWQHLVLRGELFQQLTSHWILDLIKLFMGILIARVDSYDAHWKYIRIGEEDNCKLNDLGQPWAWWRWMFL